MEIKSKNEKVTAKIIYAVQNVEKDFQFFRKTFSLSNKDAKSVYNLFRNKYGSLKELNWEKGSDGVSYIYEGKSWNNYSLNSYHSCCNDLKEAENYLEINKQLKSLINYENYFSIFNIEIPFRSCTYYGVAYTILKLQH